MNQYKTIAKSIRTMTTDINAEVIIADLIERGYDLNDMLVKHDGLFKRNYSKDILDAYFDIVKNILTLDISRDSLYDVLPHGFFHHMFNDFTSENRRLEFEKLKQEEEYARKFFLPFDNAFFNQYVELELALRKYFKNPVQFLQNLLLFEKSIPEKYATKLTSFVLFSDKIIGDPRITALLLSDIIEEAVLCSEFYSSEKLDLNETKSNSQNINMGDSLGINYICGDSVPEGRNVWEFTINLNNEINIEKYTNRENGSALKLLDLFYELFVPYEIEVVTKINCIQQTPFFIGSTSENEPGTETESVALNYLGYNTVI